MDTLQFDFTQSATRATIVEQLHAALAAQNAAADVAAVVANAGIPDHHHHNLAEIEQTVAALQGVSERVRDDMRAIYRVLTEAEAQVHGTSVETAHFHEVGRAAGIANVLEICLLMEALAPKRVTATAIQTGSGKIECAHGLMDIPAPATAAIIARGIPACENKLEGELCTPTSAAVIFHFVDEYML